VDNTRGDAGAAKPRNSILDPVTRTRGVGAANTSPNNLGTSNLTTSNLGASNLSASNLGYGSRESATRESEASWLAAGNGHGRARTALRGTALG
jgi:hypothetical protein